MSLRERLLDALTREEDTMTPTQRRVHSARSKEGLARARARGVVLGRPRGVPEEIRARIVAERAAGKTLRQIAHGLDSDAIETAQGASRWSTSSVDGILRAERKS